MFGKKKMYRVVYRLFATYTTIIEARDEFHAIRKFHRMTKDKGVNPSIISFEEYKI